MSIDKHFADHIVLKNLMAPAPLAPLANRGTITAVTNIVPAASTKDISVNWGTKTATIYSGTQTARYSSGNRISANFTVAGGLLTKGSEYMMVLQAKALTPLAVADPFLRPQLNLRFGNANYYYGRDNVFTAAYGSQIELHNEMRTYMSRYICNENTTSCNIQITDSGECSVNFDVQFQFCGIYNITGLSGIIYDATNGIYIDLGKRINLVGDSLSLNLERAKDTLGAAKLRRMGAAEFTGTVTGASAVISGISDTSWIDVGFEVRGTGIPSSSTVSSKTANSVTLNNSTTISSGGDTWTFTAGYYGGGKTTTQIAAAHTASVTHDSTVANDNTIIFMAHNNTTAIPLATALADYATIVNSLSGDYRIIGALYNSSWVNPRSGSTTPDYIDTLNAALLGIYGEKFVDVTTILAQSGNGSAADITAIQKRATPTSLALDGLHLDKGGSIIADALRGNIGNYWSSVL